MDSLPTGSIQSWLIVAAAALGPLIALLVGFAGTDRLLRWRLGEKPERTERGEDRRQGAATGPARLLYLEAPDRSAPFRRLGES